MLWRSFTSAYRESCNRYLTRACSWLVLSRELSSCDDLSSSMAAEHHDFPKEEENILELWDKLDAFRSCIRQSKDRPRLDGIFVHCFVSVVLLIEN